MPLFEVTLLLLAVAVLLMRAARHLRVPYPALLALVGGCATALPFAPHLTIEPRLALALFVAPAVMDTAFELPPRELLRNWVPLVSLAVLLVLVTTAVVAWVGVSVGGLPAAAAIALGAIVAPPDAAAAAAVLREFDLPRRAMAVLQGESLLNDAVALLAFGVAVSAATTPGASLAPLVPPLLIAVPGGILVGMIAGLLGTRLMQRVAGTLSAIIVQFLLTYGTWILAAHLNFSPILAVVALAAVAAREMPKRTSARDRINSNAVWSTVTFVLNVLAFLLMGLQARAIVTGMRDEALTRALTFSGVVLAAVIVVRFVWIMAYGLAIRRFHRYFEKRTMRGAVPAARVGILVSWCGMRGLVTLATALALPDDFPHRDEIVLSAFIVVLGTLVLQGFTIRPLIGWLRIAKDVSLDDEIVATRDAMLTAALAALKTESGPIADQIRSEFEAARSASVDRSRPDTPQDAIRRTALKAERALLIDWRERGRIPDDVYHHLEDELDRIELELASTGASWLSD
ncbi:MAG: cation:proton antiporter [Steroidobacteraceae bacterium]|jgi:Na+/H+ antiporter